MRAAAVLGSLLLSCALVGCSPNPPAPTAASSADAPSSPGPASPAAASATPSPSPPTKKQDRADLAAALVTAADLGKPWTQPGTVSRVKGKKGEICPGHTSAVDEIPTRATAGANFTEGRGAGKNIASFSLSTVDDVDDAALTAAYAADQRACARYRDGNGLFVLRSAEGPAAVAGSDVAAAWAERIYYDRQHRKLAYARHTVVVREGRVLTYLSYAFLTTKKDPRAEDFGRASRLLEVQLAKNARLLA